MNSSRKHSITENNYEKNIPALMQSVDSVHIKNKLTCLSDAIEIYPVWQENSIINNSTKCYCNSAKSFILLNKEENLRVANVEEFLEKLNCNENNKVKVVSIFGNMDDGKSHNMNQIFFNGEEIFKISNNQCSCASSVLAAFDPILNVICLDTKGILAHKCMKLFAKVLAVSDLVIYQAHSTELYTDLFNFLYTASTLYSYHFHAALKTIQQREGVSSSLSAFGPTVVVLHETSHIKKYFLNNKLESIEKKLQAKFSELKNYADVFSSLKYIDLEGTQKMDYELVQSSIRNELNIATRAARKPNLVYYILKILNDKAIEKTPFSVTIFPDQYFVCPVTCLSCECRCSNTMGHLREGKPHTNNANCQYQNQYNNIMYICQKCYNNGKKVEVKKCDVQNESWYSLAKYAWSGYILECPNCGEIYRSRQYWYGNQDPENIVVRSEITHIWNTNSSITPQNAGQRVIDSVSYISETVANVSLQPTKALSAWMADQVAPSYWRPNHEIKECYNCEVPFSPTDSKHHCRNCGEGFCDPCSSKKKLVPSKNWNTPVRVCNACYNNNTRSENTLEATEDNMIRKVSEQVVSTFGVVGNVLNYSKSFIKDSIRPSYWVPDSEIVGCWICYQKFSPALSLHHCRDCGRGVCQECSSNRKPVPYRGWDNPVRVCDICFETIN